MAKSSMSLFWEIYLTRKDEAVCGECSQYDDQIYKTDMGPMPPLHPHCRCRREFIEPDSPEWRAWEERQRETRLGQG